MAITPNMSLAERVALEAGIIRDYTLWAQNGEYDEIMSSWNYTAPDTLNTLTKHLSASTALDIGCGRGKLGTTFAKSRPNIKLDGVDICAKMLNECPNPPYENLHTISVNNQAEVQRAIGAKKFDAVISCGVIGDLVSPLALDYILDFVNLKGWFAIAGAEFSVGDKIRTQLMQTTSHYAQQKGFTVVHATSSTGYNWQNIAPVRYSFIVGTRNQVPTSEKKL